MGNSTPYILIRLEGIDISSDILSVDVEDHDRLTDKATFVMDDPTETTGEVPREGQTVTVDIGWSTEHAVLFEGVIYNVQVRAQGNARQRIIITAFDLSYRLKRRPSHPVDHTGTLSNILSTMITSDSSIGITVGQIEPESDPQFTEQLPLRQTIQTDWDFIQELGCRYGCRAFVEYNNDASQFYFIPLARLLQGSVMGELSYQGSTGQLIEIRYERLASSAAPVVSAVTNDPGSGASVAGTTTSVAQELSSVPSAGTRARTPSGSSRLDNALQVTAQATDLPENQRPQVIAAGLPSDPTLAETTVFQDPTNVLGLRAVGECVGTIMLRAKGKVSINGVASWAVGDWYVRQVNHMVDRSVSGTSGSGYRTRFIATR